MTFKEYKSNTQIGTFDGFIIDNIVEDKREEARGSISGWGVRTEIHNMSTIEYVTKYGEEYCLIHNLETDDTINLEYYKQGNLLAEEYKSNFDECISLLDKIKKIQLKEKLHISILALYPDLDWNYDRFNYYGYINWYITDPHLYWKVSGFELDECSIKSREENATVIIGQLNDDTEDILDIPTQRMSFMEFLKIILNKLEELFMDEKNRENYEKINEIKDWLK